MEFEEYSTKSQTLYIRDQESDAVQTEKLDLHIKTGDYFRVISTVLSFVEETVNDCTCGLSPELVPLEIQAIRNIRAELAYLHDNYTITQQPET
jgi:hypothetical protein